jgi:F-type H+-transporting ATPase subunit b
VLEELSIDELLAADAEGEEGEAGSEEVPNPVLPTGNEIVWAAVFFYALWALMKYVLMPPINRTREERAAKIAAAKDAVSGASSDVADKQAAYDRAIAAARAEANDIIDQARGRAEVQRASVMEAAEADVAELRATAAAELADARASAVGSLREQVASVAVGAASSVVGRPIDQAGARSTIDRVLDGSEA